mgnify:CR=1 FL=1
MNKTETQIKQTTYEKQNYYNECLNWARSYLNRQSNYFFTSDQLRHYYQLECEETIPLEARTWGAVILQLSKEKIITFVTTEMKKPMSIAANHTRKTIWKTVN